VLVPPALHDRGHTRCRGREVRKLIEDDDQPLTAASAEEPESLPARKVVARRERALAEDGPHGSREARKFACFCLLGGLVKDLRFAGRELLEQVRLADPTPAA
jgi:hypothetical protein